MKKVYIKPALKVVDLRPEEQIGSPCYNNNAIGTIECLKKKYSSVT